jgi:hypothetical protein
MASSTSETPDHLKRNGKPADPQFTAQEELYRRFSKKEVDPSSGELLDATLLFPLSTNRQKYSEPKDVLFSPTNQYAGFGIVRLLVGDIPETVPDDQGTVHWFRPAHEPEEDNFSHTHVQCENETPVGQAIKGSSTARKKCRSILKQKLVRLSPATV